MRMDWGLARDYAARDVQPEDETVTEAEWLAATDFLAMLIHLRGELTPEESEQKSGLHSSAGVLVPGPAQRTAPGRLRAFAATCLPRWLELPLDSDSETVIDAYARFLNGTGTHDAFYAACLALQEPSPDAPRLRLHSLCALWDDTPYGVGQMTWNLETTYACHVARDEIAELEKNATEDERFAWGFCGYYDSPVWKQTVTAFLQTLAPLLRETVGNPFRPVVTLGRQTITAVALARNIYDSGDFDHLPLLADALEDAGCTDAELLGDLRSPGPHVRGCWAVDLILSKDRYANKALRDRR
jgi:hypothetical protein